jgi:hypothetical protein
MIQGIEYRNKSDVNIGFDLESWVKLIYVTIDPLLNLLLILLIQGDTIWPYLPVVFDAIKKNNASSAVQKPTYLIFYRSLKILKLRDVRKDLQRTFACKFIIDILFFNEEFTATQAFMLHQTLILDFLEIDAGLFTWRSMSKRCKDIIPM